MTKEIKESEVQTSEVLRLKTIKGWAAFTKYSEGSAWTHAILASVSNTEPVLPYGWYRNREDAILAGSANYYSGNTIKLLCAEFEVC